MVLVDGDYLLEKAGLKSNRSYMAMNMIIMMINMNMMNMLLLAVIVDTNGHHGLEADENDPS